jgi:hypothetical protein
MGSVPRRRFIGGLAAGLFGTPALRAVAQIPGAGGARPATEYVPVFGQTGKDVGWVPTPQALIEKMLGAAGVTAKDLVIDLGSGDGRIPIAAARLFGARAIGVEYDAQLVGFSKAEAARQGVSDKASFVQADVFEYDFSRATVIALYLLPHMNIRLRPKILAMAPGTRVVAHNFGLGDWEPDEGVFADEVRGWLWIVPAQAGGEWRSAGGNDMAMSIRQRYQKVEGSVRAGGRTMPMLFPALRAGRIEFTTLDGSERRDYVGEVQGARLTGTVRSNGGEPQAWVMQR